MSVRHDLTRWNRASLSRFRYIDGNAVTFLELLRQTLIERFADHKEKNLQWESLVPAQTDDPLADDAYERLLRERAIIENETERERLDRIGEQYDGERRDWGWEIVRILARSAHVLTETIDTYANEGFLRTATQWDNVRRLVEMIDYHPAPPASAATLLVIEAKADARGNLEAGFQVKYSPPDGGTPVVFETLTDMDIDAELNRLRPKDFDRSQISLGGNRLILESEVKELEIGQPLVLEDETNGQLYGQRILKLQVVDGTTRITVSPGVETSLARGYTLVHLQPKDRLDSLGPGAQIEKVGTVLHLTTAPDDLEPKTVIIITDEKHIYYRNLAEVSDKQLTLKTDVGVLNLEKARVGQPVRLTVEYLNEENKIYTFRTAGDWSYLKDSPIAEPEAGLPVYEINSADYQKLDEGYYTTLTISTNPINPDAALDKLTTVLLVPPAIDGPWQVDTSIKREKESLSDPLTVSMPKKTGPGDLAVVDNGSHMAWARLGSVIVDEALQRADLGAEGTWVEADSEDGEEEFFLTDTAILAHFKTTARLKDWQVNKDTLDSKRIPLASLPDALVKGRALMVENADDPTAAVAATVAAIHADKDPPELVLDQDLPAGQTYGNTLIAANVVSAGHGERKGEKVLGSGDATRLSQSFVFADANVAFVADPTHPAGVKAAVEVSVAGRTWTQSPGFQNSHAADDHYTVRMTEEGHLKITFGDGQRGRRLPTGSNNVRLTYRKGNGLEGNLEAGRFTKAARPHYLVEAVRQPLPATGGNDMEGLVSLRENAPATLLTLERAVSLADFDYLVTSQSSVWQAKAFTRPTGLGRSQLIEVVVVPAGGGELGTLKETLEEFILAHTLPGVAVRVTPYRHETFVLDVDITVDNAAYNPEEVAAATESALTGAFSLQQRNLNQDLYLSEVYQVVEAVTGVTHSQAVIDGDGGIRRLIAGEKVVLTLGALLVSTREP